MKKRLLLVVDGFNEKNGANSSFVQLLEICKTEVDFSIMTYGTGGVLRSFEAIYNMALLKNFNIKVARRYTEFSKDEFDCVLVMASVDPELELSLFSYFNAEFIRIISFDISENRSAYRRLEKFQKILCQNLRDYQFLKNNFSSKQFQKVYLIPPSVHPRDERRYLAPAAQSAKIRERPINIVLIGSVQPRKGQLEIIDTYGHTKNKEGYCVNVVGPITDSEYHKLCIRKTYDLAVSRQVRFLGFREDWRDLLKNSDIVAVASFSEGLSNIIRYSMLMRKKLLVRQTLIDGHVLKSGYNCMAVPDKFALNFENSMENLLNMEISEQCHDTYIRELSNGKFRNRFLECLNE